jgi:hypothetical protein
MDAKPWDLLNPNIEHVSAEVASSRISICESCEKWLSVTRQCKRCGCFMDLKTKLPHAACPLGKWSAVPDESS